jgi:CBS-domain-containing membrane protein
MRVSDVMTVDVATTMAETPLREAAQMLVDRGISGMPVIADDGSVIGVVSEADVLAKQRRAPEDGGNRVSRLRHHAPDGQAKHEARRVGDAMSAPAITVVPFSSIAAAAGQMLDQDVNRLPVVDGAGRLVGIVTRADLVRAFARSDAQIAAEVREQVTFQQALSGDAGVIDVAVADGDVELRGALRRRSDADVLPRIVRLVPGVVEVRSQLSWQEEDS